MNSEQKPPGELWAAVATIGGLVLLCSSAGAITNLQRLPFLLSGDVLASALGQTAASFLGFICGPLAIYHGLQSLRGARSQVLRLPPLYVFLIAFALVLGLGNVVLNFHAAQQQLFPPLFLLGAALPVLGVVAWAAGRLGWPLTWRQATLAFIAGSTLSVLVAIVLETIIPFLVYLLVPGLGYLGSGFGALTGNQDFLTRLFFSPFIIVFLIVTALQAPFPEEFAKALGLPLFGRQRIRDERQALIIGLTFGAGFAILENMLYEGLYAQHSGWSWGGVTLLRGMGAVLHPLGTGLVALGWFRAARAGRGELFRSYLVAVGLHTLWNGGFAPFVYLTGIEYYAQRGQTLSLFVEAIPALLVAYLLALALALWLILRRLTTGLAQDIRPPVAPTLISPRALAAWALACVLVVVPIGALFAPASVPLTAVVAAGPPTPTATQTPTATRVPTATPTQTALPAIQATRATATSVAARANATAHATWPVVFSDTFTANTHSWPTDDSDPSFGPITATIAGGTYYWRAHALKGVIWWEIPGLSPDVRDLALGVSARVANGPGSAQVGLVFRKLGRDYYNFEVSDNGAFIFRARYQGEFKDIVPSARSSAIRPGALNRLGVIAEGTHFTLLINDQIVATADDSRIGSGTFGISMSLATNDTAEFEFDDFEARAP